MHEKDKTGPSSFLYRSHCDPPRRGAASSTNPRNGQGAANPHLGQHSLGVGGRGRVGSGHLRSGHGTLELAACRYWGMSFVGRFEEVTCEVRPGGHFLGQEWFNRKSLLFPYRSPAYRTHTDFHVPAPHSLKGPGMTGHEKRSCSLSASAWQGEQDRKPRGEASNLGGAVWHVELLQPEMSLSWVHGQKRSNSEMSATNPEERKRNLTFFDFSFFEICPFPFLERRQIMKMQLY